MLGIVVVVAADGGGGGCGDGSGGANVAAVAGVGERTPTIGYRRSSWPEEAKQGTPEPRKPTVYASVEPTPGSAFCRWLEAVSPD